MPDKTKKQGEREKQIPLTFLALRFIAEWTGRSSKGSKEEERVEVRVYDIIDA